MTSLSRPANALAPPPAPLMNGWFVVAGQELRDLWMSARGPSIVFAFSVLIGFITYLAATNEDLNIIDHKEAVNLVVQLTLAIGVAASVLASADAVSGERERETLESLLLAPLSQRQIVIGKLLAAASMWPALSLVAIPYVWVLGRGPGIVTDAVVVAFVVGSLLVAAFASLGMIVSIFSNSNRLSLAASFFLFVALIAPTQLALKGWFGGLLDRANPVTAGAEYVHRILVGGHTLTQDADWLWSPAVAAVLGVGLVLLAAGKLQLRGGIRR